MGILANGDHVRETGNRNKARTESGAPLKIHRTVALNLSVVKFKGKRGFSDALPKTGPVYYGRHFSISFTHVLLIRRRLKLPEVWSI